MANPVTSEPDALPEQVPFFARIRRTPREQLKASSALPVGALKLAPDFRLKAR